MAEKSGFFNAQLVGDQYDREYDSEDFAEYFASFIGNGVFASPQSQLQVLAKSGLSVTVKAGKAFIDGRYYILDEDATITFNPNANAYATNNVIVIRLDKSNRSITLQKREAVESILPTKNSTIIELVLASITLGVGASTITQSAITDRRPDTTYCGYVTGVVEQMDFAPLVTQLTAEYNEWFNLMKDQLTTDAAGSLQTQINTIQSEAYTIRSGTSNPDNSVGKDGDVYIKIVE